MRDFQYGPHLLVQDLFRAETPDHHVAVTYDDVECGVQLHVTWKNQWRGTDGPLPYRRHVSLPMQNANQAITRAVDFIVRHPIEEPYCAVDY